MVSKWYLYGYDVWYAFRCALIDQNSISPLLKAGLFWRSPSAMVWSSPYPGRVVEKNGGWWILALDGIVMVLILYRIPTKTILKRQCQLYTSLYKYQFQEWRWISRIFTSVFPYWFTIFLTCKNNGWLHLVLKTYYRNSCFSWTRNAASLIASLELWPYPSRTHAGPWVTLVAIHATMRMS